MTVHSICRQLWISLVVIGVVTSVFRPSIAQQPAAAVPQWIWVGKGSDDASIVVRKEFEVKAGVKQAKLVGTIDNEGVLFINGKQSLTCKNWESPESADVKPLLQPGKNALSVAAKNRGGIAALAACLIINYEDGSTQHVASEGNWLGTDAPTGIQWREVGFDDTKWTKASVIGAVGQTGLAWSGTVSLSSFLQTAHSSNAESGEFLPEIAANAKVPAGFKIEKIFQVPKSMGSWVSITVDPQGRLLASDQEKAGLFLITPGTQGQPTRVQRMPVELSAAQGLLYAFDALYVMVNGGEKSGLHRLTDSDGDGLMDKDEHCMFVDGGGEHGPHSVILSPDGKSLYVNAGNFTKIPKSIIDSRCPQNWQEDHLLPRRWDGNGHAAGLMAPGGWICNVDPSGKNWIVHSQGFRNEYDIAFNADGELFSYDADMEWDFGSPWYRPTRVVHATSGSEFGWRSGTGKWPEYYEDSLPAAVNIGPGSPVGITFGYGTKFPAKYQRSLFILDWTYSTIYSVELTPQGASYTGKYEDFVTGTPLPMTDAVVGKDGALYFAVGGRGTQSAVYRVSYVGNESTEPAKLASNTGEESRAIRRSLERFHGSQNATKVTEQDLQLVFKHLGSSDRFIRYAARIALEFQPSSKWRDRVLKLSEPRASIAGLLALARQGAPDDLDKIAIKLLELPHQDLDDHSKLAALRTLQVAIARRAEANVNLSEPVRNKVVELLESVYPTGSYQLDAEMVQILVKLNSTTVVGRTLDMMDRLGKEPVPAWSYLVSRNEGYGGTVGKMLEDMPPTRAIHFAFVLRNVKSPWTLEQRKRYFKFFIGAAKKPAGASYGAFLDQMRGDAIATCSDAEKVVLDELVNTSLLAAPFDAKPPVGPGRKWTTAEALETVGEKLTQRSFDAGRNLYHATSCAKCHRLSGEGGAIGPDLSTASKKFSLTDLMDAIILPSKAISDQYGSHQVVTESGTVLVGRVVELDGMLHVYTVEANAKPIVLKKSEVEEMSPSKVSQMPEGLIDTLNAEELKDLIAYILSAGNSKHEVYK